MLASNARSRFRAASWNCQPEDEHDRRCQHQFEYPPHRALRSEHGQHHERDRQRRSPGGVASLSPGLFGIALDDRNPLALLERSDVIADLLDRSLERFHVGVGIQLRPSFLAGEVDEGALDAFLFGEDTLDAQGA